MIAYAVMDDMVYQFVTTPPVSAYFSELVYSFRDMCIHLDALVCSIKYASFNWVKLCIVSPIIIWKLHALLLF